MQTKILLRSTISGKENQEGHKTRCLELGWHSVQQNRKKKWVPPGMCLIGHVQCKKMCQTRSGVIGKHQEDGFQISRVLQS